MIGCLGVEGSNARRERMEVCKEVKVEMQVEVRVRWGQMQGRVSVECKRTEKSGRGEEGGVVGGGRGEKRSNSMKIGSR